MAIVRAFKSYRPTRELADKVAALPYDVMNSAEARVMVEGNPYSFLRVDRPEVEMEEGIDIHSTPVYEKAKSKLASMIEEKTYIQDEQPCMYIYRQIMDGRVQTGLVACASIDDYINDNIKKHEHTRAEKEADRINHVDYTNANTGPIFLTYKNNAEINNIISEWVDNNEPVYDFVSEDEISHIVWVMDNDEKINRLSELFGGIENLYIADGHHRSASAVKVGLKRREEKSDFDGSEEFNYFLSVIFPDNDLYVMDYNRVVQDLNGHTEDEFMNKIAEKFEVKEFDGGAYKPADKKSYGMFIDGKWYELRAKEGIYNENDPVERLDVAILQNNLLNPILGIEDPRTSDRIDFIGGIRGLGELERRVNEGMKVAFSLHPTTIDDLMSIADAGEVMPPKSTWFEPKLRSGIFVHEL